jgi:SP family myo-inositol transporter-like MFS transporter 13
MSGAILDIETTFGLSLVQKQLVVGSLNFVSSFGALLAGSISEAFGRRSCIALSMLLYSAGTAAMTIAKSYSMLIVGRIIVGLGVGVGMATVPVLVAELAPAKLRGQLTSTFEISICTGGNRFKS